MHTVFHYFRIIGRILSSQYRYNRWVLLVSYTKLMCRSIIWHKLRRHYANEGNVLTDATVLHYSVKFFNYAALLALVEEIFVNGVYEFEASSETPVIFDCGSNIGLSVLYFKTLYPNARIVAFEPEDNACVLLRENCMINNLRDVVIHNEALTDREGAMNLYKQPFPGAYMTRVSSTGDVVEIVKASRLTEYINAPVDLLKIDVEGSEAAILDDLISSGKINSVRQMIIEFHPGRLARRCDDYLIELERLGFIHREVDNRSNGGDHIFAFRRRG